MEIVKKRSELLFLYDVKWGNPNGDPIDENKPRFDQETERVIVTDVRLKRTIRDYLHDFLGKELWVSGETKTAADRMKDLEINSVEDAVEKCIDVRLFGIVMPEQKKGALENSLTGPVQFRYGRSLHRAKWEFIQGTAAFAKEGKQQRSIREEYVVPYALLAFYGVINENLAEKTKLTEDDVKKLIEGMWIGTKNLITRSKMEQNPRLLIKINYKEGVRFHHGELDYLVKLISNKNDLEIRDPEDYVLDITQLVDSLQNIKDKIDSIEYVHDRRLKIEKGGKETNLEEALKEVAGKVE